jgi:glycerol kinase
LETIFMKLILALDQGTTGSQALLFEAESLNLLARAKTEFEQIYPKPGWVEHNPKDIWNSMVYSIQECLKKTESLGYKNAQIIGIGITNQRETVISWNSFSGVPFYNALVWQDRRTSEFCNEIKKTHEDILLQKTGLTIDPYFSSSKINWLLTNVPSVKEGKKNKNLKVGTVDSFLTYLLSGCQVHITDHTNASRTQLFNLETLSYDQEILKLFQISEDILPNIVCSLNKTPLTHTQPLKPNLLNIGFEKNPLPDGIPIYGMLGDQQAALFGQNCLNAGESKITFGTGAFLLLNIGAKPLPPPKGLLTTVALSSRKETEIKATYAFEGSCFIAGAAVQFLRDNFNWIQNSSEIEEFMNSEPRDENLIFVPSFVGLGAPYWNANAKGVLFGLTRGSTRAQIARCVVESIALQNASLVKMMEQQLAGQLSLKSMNKIGVDGGASQNSSLMQFQANVLQRSLFKPNISEATGLGAAKIVEFALSKNSSQNFNVSESVEKIFHSEENFEGLLLQWERAAQAVNSFYKS